MRLFLLLILLSLPASAAWSPPSTNTIVWNGNCGVNLATGTNIPTWTTIGATLSVGDSLATAQAAWDGLSSNQVVRAPAGAYTWNTVFQFKKNKNNRILRGDTNANGYPTTIISTTDGRSFATEDWSFTSTGADVSSGYTKGSTTITLSSSPNAMFFVGNTMEIAQDDDTNLVYKSQGGPGRFLRQTMEITAVSGNDITFRPALDWTFSASLNPKVYYLNTEGTSTPPTAFVGLEDVVINTTGVQEPTVYLRACKFAWCKNVVISNFTGTSCIQTDSSVGGEIRHCWIRNAVGFPNCPGDAVPVYLHTGSSSYILEDNIFQNTKEQLCTSSEAHFIGFNFSTNTVIDNSAGANDVHWQVPGFNCNHGPHPMMILYEGNIACQFQSDGYHGSAGPITVFRNWFHGMASVSENRKCLDATRVSYWWNVAGNVLGHSSWTPTTYTLTTQPSYATTATIYRMGYPNSGNNDFSEVVPDNAMQDDYPWLTYPDQNVTNRMIMHGNYDYKSGSQIWDPNIADHTLATSLYYNSKPAYFGGLPWPPFDPASPSSANVTNIPAGFRFVNGFDPPASFGAGGATPGTGRSSRLSRIRLR